MLRINDPERRAADGRALREAASIDDLPTIRTLLYEGHIDIESADFFEAIAAATFNGHFAATYLLLATYTDRHAQLDVIRQLLPLARRNAIRTLLLTCQTEPHIFRCFNVLLKVSPARLSIDAMFALADALATSGLNVESVLRLQETGHLLPGLEHAFGRALAVPYAEELAKARKELAPFASTSVAAPALRHGASIISGDPILNIAAALVPALPPVMAHRLWEILRKEVESRRSPLLSVSSFQRRFIVVAIDSAVQRRLRAEFEQCKMLHDVTRGLERHPNHDLASSAHALKVSIENFRAAMEKDEASIAAAQQQVSSSLATFQERFKSVLGEQEMKAHVALFQAMHSVVSASAKDLVALFAAQTRSRSAQQSRQHALGL
jgi:hypothetical protein